MLHLPQLKSVLLSDCSIRDKTIKAVRFLHPALKLRGLCLSQALTTENCQPELNCKAPAPHMALPVQLLGVKTNLR